jgi:hypothetical protein
MSPTDERFELFHGEGRCEAVLPANTVRDTFTLVAMARLLEKPPRPAGKPLGRPPKVAVIPRDVINPHLMDHLKANAFRGLPKDFVLPVVKGGFALAPRFEEEFKPKPPPHEDSDVIKQVEVSDLEKFLAEPTVKVGRETVKPELTSQNVRDLVELGDTTVIVGSGARERLVRVTAPSRDGRDGLARAVDEPLEIGDVYGFISAPAIETTPGRVTGVTLSARNVRELVNGETTRIELGGQRGTIDARPSVRRDDGVRPGGAPAMDHAGIASTSYALTAAAGREPIGYFPPTELVGHVELERPMSEDALDDLISENYLPRFELVLYMPYKQTWELLGYSRGELLNSISLAPQEETTIEVFSWDRERREREEAFTFEREGTLDVAFTDKDTTETVKEMAKSSDWKVNASGDVSVPIKGVQVGLDAGYEAGGSVKDLDRTTHQSVSEATRRASARIKTTRQTKVVEARELGTETRVTRKLRNPNMCRTLDLDYFEVLANYRVTARLAVDDARLCVLTPTSLSRMIDRNFLIAHEGILRESILSDVYLTGFDAAKLLAASERYCAVKCAPPCPCDVPKDTPPVAATESPAAEGGAVPSAVDQAAGAVTGAVRAVRSAIATLRGASPNQICGLANDVERWARYSGLKFWDTMNASQKAAYEEEWRQAKMQYHRWLYREVALESIMPRFWNSAVDFGASTDETPARLERFLMDATPQVVDAISLIALTSTPVAAGRAVDIVHELLANTCLNILPLIENIAFDDASLGSAMQQARNALEAHKRALGDASQAGDATPPAEEQREEQEEVLAKAEPPEFPPRQLAEAQVAEQALLSHVKTNESYYREAIWKRLDPNDRFRFLSLIGNVTAFAENEVLGFVGDKAVMPVRLDQYPDLRSWFKRNVLDQEGIDDESDPFDVTLPTRGVALESRLGACDSCEEFVMLHRGHDLALKAAEVKAAEERGKQEELETKRYAERLDQTPPVLDDPDPHQGDGAVRVIVVKEDEA